MLRGDSGRGFLKDRGQSGVLSCLQERCRTNASSSSEKRVEKDFSPNGALISKRRLQSHPLSTKIRVAQRCAAAQIDEPSRWEQDQESGMSKANSVFSIKSSRLGALHVVSNTSGKRP